MDRVNSNYLQMLGEWTTAFSYPQDSPWVCCACVYKTFLTTILLTRIFVVFLLCLKEVNANFVNEICEKEYKGY